MSDEIYRHEGKNSRSVRIVLDDDSLKIDTLDEGSVTEEFWGNADYQFWSSIERERWGSLAVALIREHPGGEARATDRLKEICERHGVPFVWDRWV